jgi:PAS domain S-box-containing protein
MKLLIIEDNETDAMLAINYIKRWMPDYEITWVDTLEKARLELGQDGFAAIDIILCDVNLPDGNGITLVSEVSQREYCPPIIMLSGHGIEDTAIAAVKAGAEDYIIKESEYFKELPAIINHTIRRAKTTGRKSYRPLKVLYAEHILTDIDLTLRHFQTNAPHILFDTVRSGNEVLQKLSMDQPEKWYDVLLLDFHLPGLSGLDVLEELTQKRGIKLPVVLVTGHGGENIAVQAFKLGASEYVVKNPGYLSKLPFVLENAFSRTQLFQEQQALKESEERYRRLAENAPDIIYRYRYLPDLAFEFISPAIESIVGMKCQDFYDDPRIMEKITHPDDIQYFHAQTIKNMPDDKTMLLRLSGKDGNEVWTEHHLIRSFDSQGRLTAVEGIARDVTTRVVAEIERRKSEANYHALAENLPNGAAFLFDQSLVVQLADGKLFANMKVNREDLNGRSIPDLLELYRISLDDAGIFQKILKGEEKQFVNQYRGRQISVHLLPVKNKEGEIIFGMGVLNDITEQVESEQTIQKQLHRLEALNAIDKAITGVLDTEEIMSVILRETCEQLGADAADVLILDPLNGQMRFRAGQGFQSEDVSKVVLESGQGEAGRAISTKHSIELRDINPDKPPVGFSKELQAEGFRSYFAAALTAKDTVKGVLEVYNHQPFVPDPNWLKFFETIAQQTAIALDNADLFANIQRSNLDLTNAYDATIEGWSRALDLRDKETEGHTERVVDLTLQMARIMGFPESEMVNIRRGALLHDIGKMGIPDSILLKPGPLTDDEWVIMRKHPQYAYDLILPIEYLKAAVDIPYYHHERWDGSGYPHGLKGKEIPLIARIFAVIDIWDALCSDRVYRPAWSKGEALDYIHNQAGKQLDTEVVKVFIELITNQKI